VLFLGLGLILNPVYSRVSALTLTLRVRVPQVNPSSCTPRPQYTRQPRLSLASTLANRHSHAFLFIV